MNICLDARWIFPEITGIGLYTQELIAALVRTEQPHRFTILFNQSDVLQRTRLRTGFDKNSKFCSQIVNFGPFTLANQIKLPGLLKRMDCDLYHSTNFMMPLWRTGKAKFAVTIHDLIPLLFPDHAPKSKKTRLFPIYKMLMRRIGAGADLIITVSESTRRDVIRELGIPAAKGDRVVSIPEGVDPFFCPGPPPEQSAGKVILYVGRRDPYKNLPLLVQALADLRARGTNARLRIIGPADERYPEAPALAAKLSLEAFVDWIGYVTPEQLRHEYQTADVFCLPSRYEGFGLTILEAMACGTPVVCNNTSSLPEVAGNAAILVDMTSRIQLVDALIKVLGHSETAADYRRRGLEQARRFTWDRTAQQTLQAYESSQRST